jgi:hypothetical protein
MKHRVDVEARDIRPESPAPVATPAPALLRQFAGNQAVVRHLSRTRTLARFTDNASAEALIAALATATTAQLREIVADLDAAPVGDEVGVDLPDRSLMVKVADGVELRRRAMDRLRQSLMVDLASGRQALWMAMRGAADEATRRTTTIALRDFDRPFLTDIRRFATSPATRFQHPDPLVSDAVLAAIQLEVIANAEGDLADPAEAHERSWRAAGMAASFDWCGFFAMENYLQSNLDSDLKRGFFHVTNVEHYFTYRYAFGPRKDTRVMKWIYAEDAWHELQAYHTARGSLRTWINAAAIEGGGALDIRAGDIVLIDHSGTGSADHIVMVHSFDMTTNTLFTIGGNDGGYEVDTRATHTAPRGETDPEREKREALEGATGQPLRPGSAGGHVGVGSFDLDDQPAGATLDRDRARAVARGRRLVRIYGIGRPSIVDMEDHPYDSTDRRRPPAAAPR